MIKYEIKKTMRNHIHWLLDIENGSYEAVTNSYMASQRLRAGCMMRAAAEHSSVVTAGNQIPNNTESLIVGKIGANKIQSLEESWLSLIKNHQASGKLVLLDFTDNHLEANTEMTNFYKAALKNTDHVVCSSEVLVSAVSKFFHGPIHLIPDPIEVIPTAPKVSANWPRTILWFGHSSNLPYLIEFLPMLQADAPLRLIVLSDERGLKALEQSKLNIPINLTIELRPWGHKALLESAAESDCCVIPSNPKHPRKSGASSNRLLTALALGLPTIASDLPSYLPFSEYYNSISSNSSVQVIIDPTSFSEQVLLAQRNLIPHYSMEFVGESWFSLFTQPKA